MAEVRGPLVIGWLEFLKERYGEAAVAASLDGLTSEDRKALAVRFLASSWYSYDTLHSLRRLTRGVVAGRPPDPGLPVEIGRAMARHAFRGVYRPLLKEDPARQVEQFQTTTDYFFRAARKLEAWMTSATSCVARYHYEAEATPTAGICTSVGGFWCQTLELAGAGAVGFDHPQCQAQGAPFCEFTFRWPA